MKQLLTLIALFSTIFISNSLQAQCFSEQSFTTTGEHTYIVPGATSESFLIEIEARGGDGGDFIWAGNPQTDGGEGATMGASFLVNGGDELFIIVGESGFDAIGSPGGGGGGGGSAVIINGTDVLIASAAGGGGGQLQIGFGASASTNSTAQGGAGPGTSGGGGFNEAGENGLGGTGGGAGTLTAQGAGGIQGVVAGPGGDGFGGGAGGSGTVGGGGGGYQGGDGATGNGGNYGGMGGDSFITTLYGSITLTTNAGSNGGGANVDGEVTITCTPSGQVEIAIVDSSDPLCSFSNTGSIEVVGLGGVAPYTYTIDNGAEQDNGLFENLSAGTYLLTAIDDTDNSAWNDYTIVNPSDVDITLLSTTPPTCPGGADGSFEVVGSGGTSANGTYEYGFSGGATQASGLFEGLTAGEYLVVVYDDNGCPLDLFVEIDEPDGINLIITNLTNPTCEDATNGTVNLNSTGGAGGYLYSLDGGTFQGANMFEDLGVGDFTVTVMDDNGCTNSVQFNLIAGDPFPFLILDTTNSTCGLLDGTVNMIASGGVGGYTYAVDGGASQMSGSFGDLAGGVHTATAMDAAGCTQDVAFTIGITTDIDIFAVLNGPTCFGGIDGFINLILVEAGEPYTLEWTGPGVEQDSVNQVDLVAGLYTVIVTDVNGCSLTASYDLQPGTILLVDANDVSHVTCNGGSDGSATISVSGGEEPYTYTLNGGAAQMSGDFSGLTAGTYTATATDNTGCMQDVQFTINMGSAPSISVQSSGPNCFEGMDGFIDIILDNISAPYTYSWTGPGVDTTSQDQFECAAGLYTVIVTDVNGCSATAEYELVAETTLIVDNLDVQNASCSGANDGSIAVTMSGGAAPYTFVLDGSTNNSGEYSGLGAGVYLIEVIDINGCTGEVVVTVNAAAGAFTLSITEQTEAGCNGATTGTVSLNTEDAVGTIFYTIAGMTNTSGDFTGLASGSYTASAVDDIGCSVEIIVEIIEKSSLIGSIVSLTDIICNGASDGSTTVQGENGSGAYAYSINGEAVQDNGTFDGLTAGEYEIEISDEEFCTYLVSVIITEYTAVILVVDGKTDATCSDSDDGSIIFHLEGGTAPYTINSDGNELSVGSELVEFEDVEAGMYDVLVTDANGCTYDTLVTVNAPDALEFVINELIPASCFDEDDAFISFAIIGGTAPYQIIDEDGVETDIADSTPIESDEAEAGIYPLTVVDVNGCSIETTVTITQPELLVIDNTNIVNDDGTGLGSVTIEASGGTGAYTYALGEGTDFQSEAIFTGLSEGDYDVIVMDENGCTAEFTITILMTDVTNIDAEILQASVLPNPASQTLYIQLEIKELVQMKINMTDISGRKVLELNPSITIGTHTLPIDIDHLGSGIYLLDIVTNKGHFTKKIIVQD